MTKDSPLGDVVYGIDNTFAGRALSEQVTTPYTFTALPAADADALKADGSDRLTPIDFGDVCVNADTAWFSAHHLAVPQTLEDLTKPEYKDLLVVPNPASSSPGMAFLTATVGASGDPGYLGYWTALKNNGVLVAKDWTETYSVQFSGSAGKGPRPLALSYSTSPASEVVNGAAPTQALLQTCFRQVEYAGVIAGAKNPEGAKKFIDFMLSQQVQADIPGQMYMYPALRSATLPADWVSFAPPVAGAVCRPGRDHRGRPRSVDPRLDRDGRRLSRDTTPRVDASGPGAASVPRRLLRLAGRHAHRPGVLP
ncbi:thiamine ABC transporter substrate-binding protein [Propioniciclava flava]